MKLSNILIILGALCAFLFLMLLLCQCKNRKQPQVRVVNVKGIAKGEFKPDIGEWQVDFRVTNTNYDEGKKLLDDQTSTLRKFFEEQGFEEEEIFFEYNVRSYFRTVKEKDKEKDEEVFEFQGTYRIKSEKVELVEKTYREIGAKLIEKNIRFSNISRPNYIIKDLNPIRLGLSADSTKNGVAMAKQLAANLNARLGPIKEIRQSDVMEDSPERNQPQYFARSTYAAAPEAESTSSESGASSESKIKKLKYYTYLTFSLIPKRWGWRIFG